MGDILEVFSGYRASHVIIEEGEQGAEVLGIIDWAYVFDEAYTQLLGVDNANTYVWLGNGKGKRGYREKYWRPINHGSPIAAFSQFPFPGNQTNREHRFPNPGWYNGDEITG